MNTIYARIHGQFATEPQAAGVLKAGEHYVDIVGVTGSIPVVPTIFYEEEQVFSSTFFPVPGFQITVTV